MNKATSTRSTRRKPSQSTAKAKRQAGSVKRATRSNAKADKPVSTSKPRQTARKPRKASTATRKPAKRTTRKPATNRGGGRALNDFGNDWKLHVVKKADIPSRGDCFRTGQTVSANLTAQKEAGYFGRRKFLRTQIAAGRVSVSKR